jgi:hypothetical protein
MSPTVCKNEHKTENQRPGPNGAVEPVERNIGIGHDILEIIIYIYHPI